MDSLQFDALARGLATPRVRRGLLHALLGGVGILAFGSANAPVTEAAGSGLTVTVSCVSGCSCRRRRSCKLRFNPPSVNAAAQICAEIQALQPLTGAELNCTIT